MLITAIIRTRVSEGYPRVLEAQIGGKVIWIKELGDEF